jgi:hypothetical protein
MAFDYNHTPTQLEQAYERAAEHMGAALEASLQAGFEAGFKACEEMLEEKERFAAMPAINEAYDDGYLDGVYDARLTPKFADEAIKAIMEQRYTKGDEAETAPPIDFSNHDHAEGYAVEAPSDGSELRQGTLDL